MKQLRGELADSVQRENALQERIADLERCVAKQEDLSQERLSLLRRSHIEHQLAEQHVTTLLARWPLRWAFQTHLLQPLPWALGKRQEARGDEPVSQHLAAFALSEASDAGPVIESGKVPAPIELSVILCTFNPRTDILEWALGSIARQTLDPARYELIIVDNNSTEPIRKTAFDVARYLPLRVVSETRQGLTFARICGIRESCADVIVFVDDDNHLDAEYLENALAISRREPEIGAYGGIAEAQLEIKVSKWKERLLPYLGVRNFGDKPITSFEQSWGEWEPIGAGLVVRRDAAEAFVDFVEHNPLAGTLGRSGNALLSCEDSLMARLANRCGYACSYQPSLKLVHHIKAKRLKTRYLFNLVEGMGRSYLRLQRTLGNTVEPMGSWARVKELYGRMALRFGRDGVSGLLEWGWDLGYMRELNDGEEQ